MQHNQGSQTGYSIGVQTQATVRQTIPKRWAHNAHPPTHSLIYLLCLLEIQFWERVQPVAQLTNEVEFHLESEEQQETLL